MTPAPPPPSPAPIDTSGPTPEAGSPAPLAFGPPVTHHHPPRAVAVGAVVGLLAAEFATSRGAPGLGLTLGGLLAVAMTALVTGARTAAARGLLVTAAVFSILLSLRAAPLLAVMNAGVVIVCLVLAASLAARGAWWRQSGFAVSSAGLLLAVDCLIGPFWATAAFRPTRSNGASPERSAKIGQTLLGLLLALPLLGILVVLLSSADDGFADLVRVDLDLSSLPRHLALALVGYLGAATLARRAAMIEPPAEPDPGRGPALTGNVMLGATAALFGLFAVSRILSQSSVATQVATADGVSWSGEARAGFFQLLAVAAIMAHVLVGVRSWSRVGTARQQTWTAGLGLANVGLVLIIVGDAYQRLHWYEQAYGWTRLRLACVIGAVWLAGIFLLIGAGFLPRFRSRAWLTPAALVLTAMTLGIVTLMDPVAMIAERNLSEPTTYGDVDVAYLTLLPADAVPAIVDHFDELDEDQQAMVRDRWCADEAEYTPEQAPEQTPGYSAEEIADDTASEGMAFNLARRRAADALAPIC